MGNNCQLAANLIVGNDVMFASDVSVVGGDHKIDDIEGPIKNAGRDTLLTAEVGDGSWIGHRVIILHGVKIGKGSVVAAGAVVTKNVEDYAIVAGNPAKLIRFRRISVTQAK
jgi:maltose O-acetyltransferase